MVASETGPGAGLGVPHRRHAQRPLQAGRIGPNAITRVAHALRDIDGEATARTVFERAAQLAWLDDPPGEMVEEGAVRRLHGALREVLGPARAARVARAAGTATGDYLLARRIPAVAQAILVRLPARIAERMLLAAVGRHAWTFAGSGGFSSIPGSPTVVEIADNPLCRGVVTDAPCCHFHAATFERLWRVLVARDVRVIETACCACGASACRFELRRSQGA